MIICVFIFIFSKKKNGCPVFGYWVVSIWNFKNRIKTMSIGLCLDRDVNAFV